MCKLKENNKIKIFSFSKFRIFVFCVFFFNILEDYWGWAAVSQLYPRRRTKDESGTKLLISVIQILSKSFAKCTYLGNSNVTRASVRITNLVGAAASLQYFPAKKPQQGRKVAKNKICV